MARWSLQLRYAGHIFVSDVDLDAATTRELQTADGGAEPLEVPLEVYFPEDVAALVEAGNALDAAEGDLYLDDVLILRGRVIDPEYGAPEDPLGFVSFTLRGSGLDDRAEFPSAAATVTAETWPLADPANVGQVYPQVFGAPGAPANTCGSPAYLVNWVPFIGPAWVLVCDGWAECDTVTIMVPSSGSVTVIGADEVVSWTSFSDTFTIVRGYDGLGRRVSYIDLWENLSGGVPTLPYFTGTQYHASWRDGAPFSGRLGDVLDRVLRAGSTAVDTDRLAAASESLNRYAVAGYINQRCNPTEWVFDNLLSIASIGLAWGADGVYPIALPQERTADHATVHLEEGPHCEPVGGVRWEGDPLNEFTLSYRPTSEADGYLGTVSVNPDNDPYAAASRLRYAGDAQNGVYAETLETNVIDDDAQAQTIAREIVRRRWTRPRVVTYRIWPEFWGARIGVGRLVTITSATRHWDRRPALVVNRDDDGDAAEIVLSLDEDLLRDLRA